ncbi:hypothetical protein XENTR_v10016690 [Xenopus tropicalis]|nr:hypothetical protein XENTR_v10016690 [Xenopus tropicalis]
MNLIENRKQTLILQSSRGSSIGSHSLLERNENVSFFFSRSPMSIFFLIFAFLYNIYSLHHVFILAFISNGLDAFQATCCHSKCLTERYKQYYLHIQYMYV